MSEEKFGLLPKDYPLDQIMVKILTEQIAGLYDPDSQEFFIADWTSPADERPVMSHELTHALQDQHFHIDKWTDAAKPNDAAALHKVYSLYFVTEAGMQAGVRSPFGATVVQRNCVCKRGFVQSDAENSAFPLARCGN